MIEGLLENEILALAAERWRRAADFELLADVMGRFGWTSVHVEYSSSKPWVDVKEWATENCVGEHREHNGHWIFKEPAEAMWFKMRWV